jgi:phosphoribosyl 1,2-cyclic phosphodiesterase
MLVTSLGSGSAGNSYFFESDATAILLDAGFGPRETDRRLREVGRTLADVKAIVLTHEHSDHSRGAAAVARKAGVPVYLTEGTLRACGIDPSETATVLFQNNHTFRIGDLLIHARRTLHDAADPACFVVEGADGTRVGLASDLGSVDASVLKHLSNCDGLFFESNHDLDMLRTGTYPWSLKRRIMSPYGHLSNDDSFAALPRILGGESKSICMIHLSEKNNHESIVRAMAETMLHSTGAQLELSIARQREPLPLMHIGRSRAPRPRAGANGQLALF